MKLNNQFQKKYSLPKMKQKHFTFDLNYFPISGLNIFQSIKIQRRNKNSNINKNGCGLKRFSIKNELKLNQIPEIMYFQKSMRKPKTKKFEQNLTQSSNKTKKSRNQTQEEIMWSFEKRKKQSTKKQRRVQSCPKSNSMNQNQLSLSLFKEQLKFSNLIQKQKLNSKDADRPNNLQKNSRRQSKQLESLQQCQSQFDQSQQNTRTIPQIQRSIYNLRINQSDKNSKNKQCTNSQKYNKSKKTQKSHNQKTNRKNPQNSSNQQKIKGQRQGQIYQKDKDLQRISNSLLKEQNGKKIQKKFISLNKKSYYIIGSKSNKNRSLNKQKKGKDKSLRQDANVILTNQNCTDYSSSVPSNCRNTSLSSTVNSKVKVQSSKSGKQHTQKKTKVRNQLQIRSQLFDIAKKTGQVLNKYKGECMQLKKQKNQYQNKYQEAIQKLNRIRQEIQLVINPQ